MSDLLVEILDTLIPPSDDGRMPGAGAIGLAPVIREQTLASAEVVEAGLAAAEAGGFAALDLEGRVALLRELETTQPTFIPTLFFSTCTEYYKHPKVLVGLGVDPRPPHPKGYELEGGNLDALASVRARGKLYREA
jgi:hypothetical protein